MERVIIKLLEDRPKKRGSKIRDDDLRRLASLSNETVNLMIEIGCLKVNGGEIYYKTNCYGNYYQE